jgi:hypothetical protein
MSRWVDVVAGALSLCLVLSQTNPASAQRTGTEDGTNIALVKMLAQSAPLKIEESGGAAGIRVTNTTIWEGGGSADAGAATVGGLKRIVEEMETAIRECSRDRFVEAKRRAIIYLENVVSQSAHPAVEIAQAIRRVRMKCGNDPSFAGEFSGFLEVFNRTFAPIIQREEAMRRAREREQQKQAQPATEPAPAPGIRRSSLTPRRSNTPNLVPLGPNSGGQFRTAGASGSTFMPNFNIGFAGGATNIGAGDNGSPTLTSLDTFGGGAIIDTHGVRQPGGTGAYGFFFTAEVPLPVDGPFPGGSTMFIRTGLLVPGSGEATTPFSFPGTFPSGTGTVTVKDGNSVPLLFGVGIPINSGPVPFVLQLGGGGFFTDRKTTLTVQETGAPGTPAFSTTQTQSFFDPAFSGGIRVGVADINGDGRADIVAGVDTIVRSRRGGSNLSLQSPNFATQSYTLDTARGGTDTSIIFSVNVNPAAFFAFDKSFRGGVYVTR